MQSNESDKIPLAAMSNVAPMPDLANMVVTAHSALTADLAVLAVANSKTAVRFWDGGTFLNGTPNTGDIIIFTDTTTTTSGDATFYLTSNHLSTGTALASSILSNSVNGTFIDSTANYNKGTTTIAGNLKSVTVQTTKTTNTGIIVLSLNVIGSVTYPASPNGTVVNLFVVGVSV